ncbi:hypothetical protein ES705_07251 [subsurface metagenome]
MKKIMLYEEFKNHIKFVNQTTTKILKNIGKILFLLLEELLKHR